MQGAAEESSKNSSLLQKPDTEVHNMVKSRKKNEVKKHQAQQNSSRSTASGNVSGKGHKVCSKCGYNHPYGKYLAYGVHCNSCKRKNHYSKMCKYKRNVQSVQTTNNVNDTDNNDYLLLSVHNEVNSLTRDWFVMLYFTDCNYTLKFKVDTGAYSGKTLIPEYQFKKLKCKVEVKPYRGTISSYTSRCTTTTFLRLNVINENII